jgi:purine-nucleoside phosphorylase
VPHLLATNAAGGIATTLGRGSLMAIRDHLWWKSPADAVQFQSPRPSVYSPRLIGLLHEVAASLELRLHQGVYCAVTGPSYETSAEIRAMRTWGADAVGMSTAHEIETAAKLGIEPAAISLITNAAAGMTGESLDHHDVFHEAARQATKIGRIIAGLATRLVATT